MNILCAKISKLNTKFDFITSFSSKSINSLSLAKFVILITPKLVYFIYLCVLLNEIYNCNNSFYNAYLNLYFKWNLKNFISQHFCTFSVNQLGK